MSKRKMCPYYFTTYFNGGEILTHCNKVYGENCNIDGVVTCPKNTNSRCQIVPKKAKCSSMDFKDYLKTLPPETVAAARKIAARMKREHGTKKKTRTIKGWVDVFDYGFWLKNKEGACPIYHKKVDGIPCFRVTFKVDIDS